MPEQPPSPPGGDDPGATTPLPAAASESQASRRRFLRRRPAADPASKSGGPDAAATEVIPVTRPERARPPATSLRQVARQRRDLAREREDALFHLGGVALELHRAGALGDAVVARRAEQLLALDEEFRLLDWRMEALERERLARRGKATPPELEAGICLSCRSVFAAGAIFCSHCGVRFAPETDPASLTGQIATTPPPRA